MIINRYLSGVGGLKINGVLRDYTISGASAIAAGEFVKVKNTLVYNYRTSITNYQLGVANQNGTAGEVISVYVPV